jgi:hypothetical protein
VATVAGSKRGQAYGTYQAMAGWGSLAGGIGFGWVYQSIGGGVALTAAGLVSAAVLFGWLVFTRPGQGRAAA